MEKYTNKVKLLNRFSNAKWVLSYYDDFPLCNVLMTSLCKDSKLWWDNNYNAFWNALEFTRKTFSYLVPFDSKVAEYLLEHSRFKIYSLSVIISTNKSIADLIDFINAVKVPSMLKFKKIEWQSNKINIAAYNELWNLFNDKKWLDVNKIKASNTNFDTNNIDDFLEISHISYVKKSKNIKLFEQWHEYRVEHDAKHFIDKLSECYTKNKL